MFKKMIYLAIVFSVMVGFKGIALSMEFKDDNEFEINLKDRSFYAQNHTRNLTQVSLITEKSNQVSQNEKYKELKEKLKDLMEELKRLGKDIEKKVIKEILPRIKREIEKLKKKLREFHFYDDEPEPVEV